MSGLIKVRASWNAAEKEWAQTNDKRTHAKLKKLCKLEHNRTCADCCAKYPGWAALPHGIHICIDCAQVHRRIGRHISMVKAINTGTYLWHQNELECITKMGNARAERLYLGSGRPPAKPASTDAEYIQDKYERKLWFDTNLTLADLEAEIPAADAPRQSFSERGGRAAVAGSGGRVKTSSGGARSVLTGRQARRSNRPSKQMPRYKMRNAEVEQKRPGDADLLSFSDDVARGGRSGAGENPEPQLVPPAAPLLTKQLSEEGRKLFEVASASTTTAQEEAKKHSTEVDEIARQFLAEGTTGQVDHPSGTASLHGKAHAGINAGSRVGNGGLSGCSREEKTAAIMSSYNQQYGMPLPYSYGGMSSVPAMNAVRSLPPKRQSMTTNHVIPTSVTGGQAGSDDFFAEFGL